MSIDKTLNLENLTREAYKYFAKGDDDSTDSYKETVEYKALLKQLTKKEKQEAILLTIAEKVILEFGFVNMKFDNMTLILRYDRCVKGSFTYRIGNACQSIQLYISLLIPYYVICESKYNSSGLKATNESQINSVNALNKRIINYINGTVKTHVAEFNTMPEHLLDLPIFDIIFNSLGILIGDRIQIGRPMKVFNVFFSGAEF